jgi:hypothetical protein
MTEPSTKSDYEGPVKIFAFLPRKAGIGAGAFHTLWRHPHGTLARDIDTFTRYLQAHRVDGVGLPGAASPHDGAAEMWFATLDDGLGLGGNRYYTEVVIPDESNFIDLGPFAFRVLTREEPLADRGFDPTRRGVKLVHGIRRPVRASRAEFHDAFPDDAEIQLGIDLGVTRHVICRALPETYGDDYVPFDGTQHHWLTPEPFDAIRELWWEDLHAFRDALRARPDAWGRLRASPLVDPTRSSAFVADEHIVVAG